MDKPTDAQNGRLTKGGQSGKPYGMVNPSQSPLIRKYVAFFNSFWSSKDTSGPHNIYI